MIYVSIFNAKENVSIAGINKEREEWYQKGKDKTFHSMCKRIERFEVAGKSPLKIFFVVETDNPDALNMLSRHFGASWTSETYPVLQREIHEALEQDKSIIGG